MIIFKSTKVAHHSKTNYSRSRRRNIPLMGKVTIHQKLMNKAMITITRITPGQLSTRCMYCRSCGKFFLVWMLTTSMWRLDAVAVVGQTTTMPNLCLMYFFLESWNEYYDSSSLWRILSCSNSFLLTKRRIWQNRAKNTVWVCSKEPKWFVG